jgi:hypothetical protein
MATFTAGCKSKAAMSTAANTGITTFIDSSARANCPGLRKRYIASCGLALRAKPKTVRTMLTLTASIIRSAKFISGLLIHGLAVSSYFFSGSEPGSVYFSRSLSRKKLRKVRMTAIAPSSPMSCQVGEITLRTMSAANAQECLQRPEADDGDRRNFDRQRHVARNFLDHFFHTKILRSGTSPASDSKPKKALSEFGKIFRGEALECGR